MKCPYCGNSDTRVIDSRPAEEGNSIRRRRSCDACGKRFTTYEKIETIPLIIIKKDDNLSLIHISWILKDGDVCSVLIGASRPEQILDNIATLQNISFTKEELDAIDRISKA